MTVHSLESGGSGYFYNLYICEKVMGLIPRGFSLDCKVCDSMSRAFS